MRIETYPAEDVPSIVAGVHPSLLHVVRIGKGKRYNHLEPVPTKIHWRQEFEIQGNKVFVINRTSELDEGRWQVPAKDVVTEMHNNTITLGSSKEHLNLVILRPKQSNCDATITKVLGDRLEISRDEAEQYKKHFVGDQGGINLMKIRLKVTFYNAVGVLICSSISPQTVVDNGNKKIGCLKLYDCTPRKSHPSGGRKVIMTGEYNLADDVVPRFEVYDSDGNYRPDVDDFIMQPSKWSADVLSGRHFVRPALDVLSGPA